MAVILNAYHTFSRWLDSLCGIVCVACLFAMVALSGAQILWRLCFSALSWSEELTRYLMVWATFLGAGCVYRRMGHIGVTLLQNAVPEKWRTAMQIASHLLCGAFFLLAVDCGIEYMGMQSRQLSAALRIPMSWVYLAIPVGCGVMACHVLDLLLRMVPLDRKGGEAAA